MALPDIVQAPCVILQERQDLKKILLKETLSRIPYPCHRLRIRTRGHERNDDSSTTLDDRKDERNSWIEGNTKQRKSSREVEASDGKQVLPNFAHSLS